MSAILVAGGTKEERLELAEKRAAKVSGGVDLVVMEEASGIEASREITKTLSRKPYQSRGVTIILPEADKLTIEAQNALLKTLEEPPPTAQLILLTGNPEKLLPTVRSRCEVLDLGTNDTPVELADLKSAWRTYQEGNLNYLFESAAEADPAVWAELFRQILLYQLGGPKLLDKVSRGARITDFISVKDLEQLSYSLAEEDLRKFLQFSQKISALLSGNINKRLALENLFLRLPRPKTQS